MSILHKNKKFGSRNGPVELLDRMGYIRDARAGDLSSAWDYIKRFGDKHPKKAKEMAELIVNEWDFGKFWLPDAVDVAEKYSLMPELVERVKSIVNSKEYQNVVDKQGRKVYRFATKNVLYEVGDFLLENKLQHEFENIEEFLIRIIKNDEEDFVLHYVDWINKYNINVNEKIYEPLINSTSDLQILEKYLKKYPDAIDYKRIFLGKIGIEPARSESRRLSPRNFVERNDLRDLAITLISLRSTLFTEEEFVLISDQIRSIPGLLEELKDTAYFSAVVDCDADPSKLEKYVLDNKSYELAILATWRKGVDVKKIEQMVLEKQDFWLSYNYAMKAKSADKQKHLDVMMENLPYVAAKKVSYGEASVAVRKSEHINFQIYGECPPLETSETKIERTRAKMQDDETRRVEREINAIHDAISTLTKEIKKEEKQKQLKEEAKVL